MQKVSLVLPYEFEIVFKSLPLEDAGRLILAIYAYEQQGETPDFSANSMLQFAWNTHIKPKIDENIEKYNATCEARRRAGSLGGKANQEKQRQANQANATFATQEQANQAKASDVDGDGDIDCDVDCDCDVDITTTTGFSDDALKVSKLWEQRFGLVSSYRMQNIQDLVDEYGIELAEFAIKTAHQKHNSNFQYIKGIARNEKMRMDTKPPPKETLEEIGARMRETAEESRKKGKSKTMDEIKRMVEEKRKANGEGTTA